MQQDFAELTVAAVENVYGPLTACVYSVLACHGRQNLRGLVKHARLPPRQIKPSLVILVQHHLVLYETDDLDQAYYSANGDTAYNTAFRFGKFAKIVEDQFGEKAASVFTKIATLGQSTIKDVVDEFEKDPDSTITASHIDDVVDNFLKHGYLCRVTFHHFQPDHLLNEDVEKEINSIYGGPPKAKDKIDAVERRVRLKQRARDEAFSDFSNHEPPPKRQKLETPTINGSRKQPASFSVKPDVLFTINYEKCTVLLRNSQLVRLAHRYIGDTTAKVFEALLNSVQGYTMRCYDPYELRESQFSSSDHERSISSSTILEYLDPPHLDLGHGIPGALANGVNGINGVNGHHDSNKRKLADPVRTLKLQPHLNLLKRLQPTFVDSSASGYWRVPFKSITRALIEDEIENTITARFGPIASRVIRILQRHYSADEKFLAASAILKPKEVRATTNALLAAGLVHTQEVPRDANRTTNRLLWLYAYDPSKARQTLIVDSYRAMLRLMKRMEAERKDIQDLIEKSERTDVQGKEQEFLNLDERERLDRFYEVEKAMLAHIGRIDDLVACLRDFAPLDDPFIGNRQRPKTEHMENGFASRDDDD